MSGDYGTYRDRAESYFASMKALCDLGNPDYTRADPDYRAAVALLAVHAAISFSDAVLVAADLGPSSGSHEKAPDLLKTAAKGRKISTDGISCFARLAKDKNSYAYSSRQLTPDDVSKAVLRIESFAAWAYIAIDAIIQARSAT